jgi:hypothetical protein
VIRIAVSQTAFEALASMPALGSMNFENATNERGERYVWLAPDVVNRAARHARPRRELQRRHHLAAGG